MSRPTSPSPGHRREAVAAQLRNVMQDLLARGLNDPRIQGLVTITGVEVDAPITRALVRVSVMPEKNQARVMAGLRHSAKHLRHKIGEALPAFRVPELVFEVDVGLKNQAAVIAALGRVAAEREARGEAEGVDSSPPAANNAEPPRADGAGLT